MGKPASDATLLRQAKYDLKEARVKRDQFEKQMIAWQHQANDAIRDANDWKRRFDALLARDTACGPGKGE
jgi:hypothetical protein